MTDGSPPQSGITASPEIQQDDRAPVSEAEDLDQSAVASESKSPAGLVSHLHTLTASGAYRRGREYVLPVVLVFLLGAIALINHFSGHDWGGDFALYMRQAKALAIGNIGEVLSDNRFSVDNSGWHTFSPYSYPWGWPLLIAPLYAVFGLNYEVFKFVEVLAFCLFLSTFFILVRRRAGTLPATLLTLLFGLSPIYIGGTGTVLSDIPYLGFVGLSLWWMDRCRMRGLIEGASRNELIVMGLLLVYTYNIRREGITLVFALAALHIVSLKARPVKVLRDVNWKRVSIPYVTFFFGVIVFHLLLPTVLLPSAPGTGLQNVSSRVDYYRDILAQQIGLQRPGSPIELLGSESAGHRALFYLVVLGAIGLVARLWQRREEDAAIAAFLACSSLLMLVSPYQEGRYLFTITPFLAYFAYQAVPTVIHLYFPQNRMGFRIVTALSAVALFGLVIPNARVTAESTDYHLDYTYVVHGPESPDAQEMFEAVRQYTRADDVILFFRARPMTLYADRRSIMGANLEQLLPRSDWYVMAKNSTYSQKLLSDAEAEAYGLTKTWENEGWVMWRVPQPSF